MLKGQPGRDGTAGLDGGGQSEVLGPWKEQSWGVGGPGLNAAEVMSKLKNATVPIGLDFVGSPPTSARAIWAAWGGALTGLAEQ